MSYDLILATKPGSSPPVESLNEIRENLPNSISDFTGASSFSDPDDPEGIKCFLEADGFYDPKCKQAFLNYCDSIGTPPDPLTPELAQRFWNATEGCTIATVTLPRNKDGVVACLKFLISLAKGADIRLSDPQAGCDIDLESPPETPPQW